MMDVKDSKRLSLEERASEQFSMPTEAERALLRAVQEGKNADCRTSEALRTQEEDPSRANEWDDQRTIRAPLLRWLCVDRAAKECVDPYGIRISFAKLSGRLDLSYATLPFPLVCNSCWWPEGVDLTAAALPSLSLEKTWMGPLEGLVGQNGAERLIIVANRAVIRGVVLLRNGFHAEGEVRLYGVEIGGNLECDNGTFKNPGKRALNAERAKIGGAVYLRNGFNAVGEVRLHRAELGGLECDGGSFDNSGQLALNAEGARIRGAVLFRGGFLSEGEVRLFGAETGGNLNCDGARFNNPGNVALHCEGARIGGAVLLRKPFVAHGEVRLFGAETGGNLDCNGARFDNPGDIALDAERAKIGGAVYLRNDFNAAGEVRLHRAELGGLECVSSTFTNPRKRALNAEGARIRGAVLLRDGFVAEGEVRLYSTEVGGNLNCVGASCNNPGNVALHCEGARIGGAVLLRKPFVAHGEVRLQATEIGISLECDGGSFKNAGQRALNAEFAEIRGSTLARNHFTAEGEVRFFGTEIGGNLECWDCSFDNSTGPALNAEGASISGTVVLRDGFVAKGEVRLYGAAIGGNLNCEGGNFKNPGGIALNAVLGNIGRSVFLRSNFQAEGDISLFGATIGGDLDLSEANLATEARVRLQLQRIDVKGALILQGIKKNSETEMRLSDTSCVVLDDSPDAWSNSGRLNLDGFTFRRIRDPGTPDGRLEWLRGQLPPDTHARRGRFRPQPYRHLAGVLRAHGLDSESKQILIGMAEDRRKWGNLSWPSRFWQGVLWFTIRNGYQPLRATLWLGVLWLIGFIAFGLGYQAHVMVPSERFAYEDFVKTGEVVGQHEPFCALAYAIDLSLPIISFGQKDRWHPMGTTTATAGVARTTQHSWIYSTLCQATFTRHWTAHGDPAAGTTLASILHLYRWVHVVLGWFLATMLVAGVSGLVGRE